MIEKNYQKLSIALFLSLPGILKACQETKYIKIATYH